MGDTIITHNDRLNTLENRLLRLERNIRNNNFQEQITDNSRRITALGVDIDDNFHNLQGAINGLNTDIRNQLQINNRIFHNLEMLTNVTANADTKIDELRKYNDQIAKKKAATITLKKIAEGSSRSARTAASTARVRESITSFLSTAGKRKKQTRKRSKK
jgi:RecJ-like exonuclease